MARSEGPLHISGDGSGNCQAQRRTKFVKDWRNQFFESKPLTLTG
jgi:hypothetical protein